MDRPLREPGLPLEAEALRERPETRRGPAVGPALWLVLPPVVALAAVVAVWEVWTRLADVPVYIVPAPSVVASRLLEEPGYFAGHAASTLAVAMGGFALGSAAAIAVRRGDVPVAAAGEGAVPAGAAGEGRADVGVGGALRGLVRLRADSEGA